MKYKPAWPCLIIKVLATQTKFLEPSGYCTVINYDFTFHTTNSFGSFRDVMAKFEFVKDSQIRLHFTFIYVVLNHTWSEAMHNISVHYLPQYYQPQQTPAIA